MDEQYKTCQGSSFVWNPGKVYYPDYEYCQYRLPCGICERLERQCLKEPSKTTITYDTNVTTNSFENAK